MGLEHLLGLFSQLVRIVLELLVQLLVRRGAVLSQGRRIHGVSISRWVLGLVLRAGRREARIRVATGLEPHLTGKHVGFRTLERGLRIRTLRILNELVALSRHPAVLVVRRNLTQKRAHQLDVRISHTEGAEGRLDQAVEGPGHVTVCLAEHFDSVAALVGERLNPDAVLLVSTCGPGVLFTLFVRPGDALITRTKRKRALAAVTGDHIRESVSLRAEDRRVGAVLVTELRVDGNTVQLHVVVVVGGTRVAVQAGHKDVTRNQALTDTVSVS